MVPGVAASYPLALQQQLEHASHQSGFSTEDRQKAAAQQVCMQQGHLQPVLVKIWVLFE